MVFDSWIYGLVIVRLALELAGVKYLTQPQFRLIRWFMAFCALRDCLLFAVHGNAQAYWDVGWGSKQIELVWLGFIAGKVNSLADGRFTRPARIPAFGIAVLSVMNLPFLASAPQMQDYQWHSQVIILGTVLIGCLFSIQRRHLELAGSVAILGLSGLLSAVSFVTGNYSPKVAGLVWIAGLVVLLTAATGNAQSFCNRQSRCATSSGE